MKNYKARLKPGLEKLSELSDKLNCSKSDLAHEIHCELLDIEDLLINPLQSVPKNRYIHMITSFCNHECDSHKAHSDIIVEFQQEVSPAALYIAIEAHIKSCEEEYNIRADMQEIEEWLNKQKALYKTAKHTDYGFIEDTGLTVADIKTDYGSIDFFMEFAINYEDK